MTFSDLPEEIQDKIAGYPEFKYGVNKVCVVLDDGTKVPDVYVAWGKQVIKVGTSEEIKFDPSRVVDAFNEV